MFKPSMILLAIIGVFSQSLNVYGFSCPMHSVHTTVTQSSTEHHGNEMEQLEQAPMTMMSDHCKNKSVHGPSTHCCDQLGDCQCGNCASAVMILSQYTVVEVMLADFPATTSYFNFSSAERALPFRPPVA